MKKLSLLVFSVVLAAIVAGCTKENASEITGFTGIEVEVGENNGSSRLFILNEGAFPGTLSFPTIPSSFPEGIPGRPRPFTKFLSL